MPLGLLTLTTPSRLLELSRESYELRRMDVRLLCSCFRKPAWILRSTEVPNPFIDGIRGNSAATGPHGTPSMGPVERSRIHRISSPPSGLVGSLPVVDEALHPPLHPFECHRRA